MVIYGDTLGCMGLFLFIEIYQGSNTVLKIKWIQVRVILEVKHEPTDISGI